MNLRFHISALLTAAMLPLAATAMQLDLPNNSEMLGGNLVDYGSYKLPLGAWQDGGLKTLLAEGEVTQQAWKISASSLTSLQIMEPLKEQLDQAGFDVVFECETLDCGGFDFRFGTDVMPEPSMHVDLGDFRFLSAQRLGLTQPEYVSLLISRSQNAGFVQLMHVGAATEKEGELLVATSPALTSLGLSDMPLEVALNEYGRYILEDLVFETGSADLSGGEFATLTALADFLAANPARTVALVGHTDSEGSLKGNIALSKKRAASVVDYLVAQFNVDAAQISAEGNGFLSPLASNMTEDGRAQNRRVEVVDTTIQ